MPTPKKRYYDFACWFMTQITFSFTTTPFLVLGFNESLRVWANVYMYAVVWTVASMGFFASPARPWLKKRLEVRAGKVRAKLSRTVSSESITGGGPILGISRDLEEDINDAVEELRREMEARQGAEKPGLAETKKEL